MSRWLPRRAGLFLFSLLALACASNPVTGQPELAFLSESYEIGLGERLYAQARQSQGGDYTVDPELSAYVAEVGARVAAVSDRAQLPYEFSVLNSSSPNAWALPGGKIAVNRGLLQEMESEAELAALLGHEVTHAAARHTAKSLERGLLLQGAVLATAVVLSEKKYAKVAVGGANVAATLVTLRYGRDAEREADYYGTLYMDRAGYDPRGAVSLQEILLEKHESGAPGWLEGLFASHPYTGERLAANRRTAEELLAGGGGAGELGVERFQAVMGTLIAQREFYEAYDEARKALSKGDVEGAQGLALRALEGVPREPNFHTLEGELFFETERYPEAVASYDRAIDLDGGYFLPYLGRGQARRALGDRRGARADLERSAGLLPTAEAQVALGELAEERGAPDEAVSHYRSIAALDGPLGARARASMTRIELPRDPGAFLAARPLLGLDGTLWVEVENRAGLAVRDVLVEVRFGTGPQARVVRSGVRGEIPPGQTRRQSTGIGPVRDPASLEGLELRVMGAQLAADNPGAR